MKKYKDNWLGRTDALKVECIACGALPSEKCHGAVRRSTNQWYYRNAVHVERLRDAYIKKLPGGL